MPDIIHRVGIKASAGKVFRAISTIDGLTHWWIVSTKGKTKKGGTIDFGFTKMRVMESVASKRVKWRCVNGPDEWLDTEVSFELKPRGGQTFVIFKHANWKRPVEFMHHCSTKWAVFMLSLRDWVEREEGRPHPYDVKIHVGD